MQAPERYVVPVAVGASPRFGENRSSKRAQSVVVALGGAMALCLLVCRTGCCARLPRLVAQAARAAHARAWPA